MRDVKMDSLVRAFLGVDLVQRQVISIIMDKLLEFGGRAPPAADMVDVAGLLMIHFRWLEHVADPTELRKSIVDIVPMLQRPIAAQLIACLPEILDDSEHRNVAKVGHLAGGTTAAASSPVLVGPVLMVLLRRAMQDLCKLVDSDASLLTVVLGTLTELNVDAADLGEMREMVTVQLRSANPTTAAALTRFILNSVGSEDAYDAVDSVRKGLDLQLLCAAQCTSPSSSSSSSDSDAVLLTLAGIQAVVQFKPPIANAWLKAVAAIDTADSYCTLDFFVLLMLYGIAAHRRMADRLLRKGVSCDGFTLAMLNEIFQNYPAAVRPNLENLLELADSLLRHENAKERAFSCAVYRHVMLAFENHVRAGVLRALIAHICNAATVPANMALDLIAEIAESNGQLLAPFLIAVKCLLDYLHVMSVSRVYKLFRVLVLLTIASVPADAGPDAPLQHLLADDVQIVIQKQLKSAEPRYRRIGIAGVVCMIEQLAKFSAQAAVDTAIRLIDMVPETGRTLTMLSFFADELVRLSRSAAGPGMQLLKPALEHVHQCLAEMPMNRFLLGANEVPVPPPGAITRFPDTVVAFQMDRSGYEFAINIWPFLSSVLEDTPGSGRASLLYLPSALRLFSAMDAALGRNIDGIQLLLYCPVLLYCGYEHPAGDQHTVAKRVQMCWAMLHACNWFREIVNVFMVYGNGRYADVCRERLRTIVACELYLSRLVAQTPAFVPQLMAQYEPDMAPGSLGQKGAASRHADTVAQADAADNMADAAPMASACDPSHTEYPSEHVNVGSGGPSGGAGHATASASKATGAKGPAAGAPSAKLPRHVDHMATVRPFLRELDLDVLRLLDEAYSSSASGSVGTAVLARMGPQETRLLLSDALAKLESALQSADAPKRPLSSQKLPLARLARGVVPARGTDQMFEPLSRPPEATVVSSVLDVLPFVVKRLRQICERIREAHRQRPSGEACIGAEMAVDTDEAGACGSDDHEAECVDLSLMLVLRLLSWKPLTAAENDALLARLLRTLSAGLSESEATMETAFDEVCTICDGIPSLYTTTLATRVLHALATAVPTTDSSMKAQLLQRLSTLCDVHLQQQWRMLRPRDGATSPAGLAQLCAHLKWLTAVCIQYDPHPLTRIRHFIDTAIPALHSVRANTSAMSVTAARDAPPNAANADDPATPASPSQQPTYPLLTRQTFRALYEVLTNELCREMDRFGAPSGADDENVLQLQLQQRLSVLVALFTALVKLVITFDRPPILAAAVRFGIAFLKAFLHTGVPFLRNSTVALHDDVGALVKQLQAGMRQLQWVCAHIKAQRGSSMLTRVPWLKKILERAMLCCSDLVAQSTGHPVSLGVLRPRDLQGRRLGTDDDTPEAKRKRGGASQ